MIVNGCGEAFGNLISKAGMLMLVLNDDASKHVNESFFMGVSCVILYYQPRLETKDMLRLGFQTSLVKDSLDKELRLSV